MRKPRILYLVQLPPPIHGASEMNRMVVESEVVNAGFERRVIPLDFSSKLSQLQRFSLVKVVKAVAILFRLIYCLIAFRPRIVYFSMVPFGPLLLRDGIYLLLIRIFGAKPVIHLHRPGLDRVAPTKINLLVYKNLFRNCKVIHLSPLLVERELIPLGLDRLNLFSFPNSVDFNPVLKVVSKDPKNILFFSNLYPHKGFFKLMEAFSLIADKYPELTLTVAGNSPDPTLPQRIIDLAESLNLKDRITYIGGLAKEDREAVYRNADIFVLPSESEYFPLVILEAMLAGVPVICTGKENIGCYFEDGVDVAYLVNNPSVKEIADKLLLTLDDNALRSALAESAFLKVSTINGEGLKQMRLLFMDCIA